ncbi:MAG: hypothetical protein ACNA8S_11520 [Deferrisomatales bacterium]
MRVTATRFRLRGACGVLAVLTAVLGAGKPGAAEEGLLLRMLGPPARGLQIQAAGSAQWRPERDTRGDTAGESVEVRTQKGDLLAAIPMGHRGEGSAALRLRHHGLAGEARLPASGTPLPDHLWDLGLGVGYRRFLTPGRWAGLAATVGSPSDRPFRSGREVAVSATALYRLPHGERAAWLLFLRYDNTREFWNHVPLPGLAYSAQPTPRSLLLLGAPFFMARWGSEGGWGASLFYFWPRTLGAEVTRRLPGHAQAYAGFHLDSESHFLAGRDRRGDRLWYYEKRAEAGVRRDPSPRWGWEVSGGYAFDRYYFLGEDFKERTRDRAAVAGGPFLRAGVKARF